MYFHSRYRQILDCCLIANETVEECRLKKKKGGGGCSKLTWKRLMIMSTGDFWTLCFKRKDSV